MLVMFVSMHIEFLLKSISYLCSEGAFVISVAIPYFLELEYCREGRQEGSRQERALLVRGNICACMCMCKFVFVSHGH